MSSRNEQQDERHICAEMQGVTNRRSHQHRCSAKSFAACLKPTSCGVETLGEPPSALAVRDRWVEREMFLHHRAFGCQVVQDLATGVAFVASVHPEDIGEEFEPATNASELHPHFVVLGSDELGRFVEHADLLEARAAHHGG